MRTPTALGPTSAAMAATIAGRPQTLPALSEDGGLADPDFQLALWMAYELHYRGFEDVPDEREWDASVLSRRAALEARFESQLRAGVGPITLEAVSDVPAQLVKLVAEDDGPALSSYLQRTATYEQFCEFVIHRSVYHLKEADPHTWAIPRLTGRAKAALVEIQSDEYGGGRAERMHSELFGLTMRGFGLDASYGHYVARVPGVTLAISNLMSMFGLHRRLRGALAGHLAVFEMTSSVPNRRYARGVRRLGGSDATARFYDEHVEADSVHEQVAAYDLCGSLAESEPQVAEDILFGGAAALLLDARFGQHILAAWSDGRSSLR